ncbi:MAG: hypothetical protein U9P42_06340 [Candidatus Fermentibacteria bacterium]|nr:hypothetical protein [Candidatus Fermentibacteria bacterium]
MVEKRKTTLSPLPLLKLKPASAPALFLKRIRILTLFCLLFPGAETAYAEEILFSEDFQDGIIGEQWTFFGDPTSIINQEKGNPPPSFCNNGDSMYGSGVCSRETFSIEQGLVILCDLFVTCHPRGSWVDDRFYICDAGTIERGQEPPCLIGMSFAFLGELNWSAPHLQGVLGQHISRHRIPQIIHANHWLDGWHTFKIEITPEGLCSFMIDDSLLSSHQTLLQDSVDRVGIVLSGRSTSWGIALQDNLLVYVP